MILILLRKATMERKMFIVDKKKSDVGALLLRLVSPLFCIGEIKWRMVNLEEVSLNISSSVFTSPSFIFLVIN